MGKYVTEFIGTFFLVLVIGLTAVGKNPFGMGVGTPLAPIAIGSMLMVMIFMGGHVSGAHYNPAVSLAACLRGKLSPVDFVIYVLVQIGGALAASEVVFVILGRTDFFPVPNYPLVNKSVLAILLVEGLFTFALALVVLNAATAKGTAGNSFYGLAIGFTVLAAAFAGGPISGGAFNPAVGIGPIVVDAMVGEGKGMENLWLYLVGPFAGGAAAAAVFRLQNPGDFTGTNA